MKEISNEDQCLLRMNAHIPCDPYIQMNTSCKDGYGPPKCTQLLQLKNRGCLEKRKYLHSSCHSFTHFRI